MSGSHDHDHQDRARHLARYVHLIWPRSGRLTVSSRSAVTVGGKRTHVLGVQMQVRHARQDDVTAIQSVGRRTWPSTYTFAGEEYIANGLNTWWSLEALERSLETTICLVAEDSGELLGRATS